MDNKEKALALHGQHFNCAQSVFGALAEKVGIDGETALKAASCFGGGMRCGEVCGAVTGALMALGIRFGWATEDDPESKAAAYRRTEEFIQKYREKRGTILCRELLGYNIGIPEEAAKIRELGLYEKICNGAITDAVEIAEEIIRQG